jgi:hypothetical protein
MYYRVASIRPYGTSSTEVNGAAEINSYPKGGARSVKHLSGALVLLVQNDAVYYSEHPNRVAMDRYICPGTGLSLTL